ncbi:restriction endonuclease subunit S [Morganella morganii]|uniref:restriction endonuclease subunit S n=1 Tax=Morganella morganii TaxID=582 RepID=UPI0028D57A55|nr:restriction endonuclease subunit S [uncultured Moellerella sp.]
MTMSTIKIGDLGRVVTGKTPSTKSPEYWNGEYDFITPSDIKDDSYTVRTGRSVSNSWGKKSPQYLLPEGTTCYVCIGATIGKNCYVSKPSFSNQQINAVIPDTDRFNPKYVYALLNTISEEVKNRASGAATPIVNKSSFSDISIEVHRKNQQDLIVNILENYDNLIENNNRRIAILEDMAQSLYREWFVNFRYPNHQDNLDAEGNPKLIDSPLGQIPEGWEFKRLDDYVELQRGFDLPKDKRNVDGGVPIYAASGLTGYHNEIKVRGPGIVTGRSGTLGIVKLVLEDHWPLNTSLWVKKFRNCTAYYAYYLLDSIGLERFNSGASVPTLNRNDVHGNPVISPPNELIDKFEEIAAVLHKQINVLQRKNENLKQQRDMLLPKLISGQIEL